MRARLVVCALALLATLVSRGAHADDEGGQWAGQWDSHWRTGRARLVLTQEGEVVRGVYFPRDGEIEGRVDADTAGGRILRGTFREDGRRGEFTFSLAPDGQSFMGRFDSGEWWNGGRLTASTNLDPWEAELGSPRDALKSFLTSFNEIRYGGLGFVHAGLDSVTFAPVGEGDDQPGALNPTERFRRATLLFDVIDACVMHLWDVPDASHLEPGATEHTYELRQLGTPNRHSQRFVRDPQGRWRLVVPPRAELLTLRTRLRMARGNLRPDPREHFSLPHPRGTIRTFIEQVKLWDDGGAELAMSTLDLSHLDPEIRDVEAPLIAEYLKQVLDRAGFLIWQELPNDPNSREPYVHFEHPLGRVVVAPMVDPDHPDRAPRWQFTAETLANIRTLYDAFEDLPVAEGLVAEQNRSVYFRLRSRFRHVSAWWVVRVGAIERWQAASVVVALLFAFFFIGFVGRVPLLAAKLTRKRDPETRERRLVMGRRYFLPLGVLLAGLGLHQVFEVLGVPPSVLWVLGSGSWIAAVFGGTWLLFSALNDLGAYLQARSRHEESVVDGILVSLATSTAKIAIVVAGIFLAADILHIPYRTVFAGLGIGGLAFAIAAQDTLANFFGSAVLLADRPFRRGDLVRVTEHTGFVEHVGLRSTQIRTFDDSVVVIPNRVLAAEVIDNRGRRRMRVIAGVVGATYDATPETLDLFVDALREMLRAETGREDEDIYVGVSGFGDSAIEVSFRTTFDAETYGDEVERRHALLLEVARVAEKSGVEFAFPTQTVHLADG